MPKASVRIYEGARENTSVIGATSTADFAVSEEVQEFLRDDGYEVVPIIPMYRRRPEGEYGNTPSEVPQRNMSYSLLEVWPPLSDASIKAYGEFLCTLTWVKEHRGQNDTAVIDYRDPEDSVGTLVTYVM